MNIGGMGNMFKQAQQLQTKMAKLKEELGSKECEASVGGGAVTVWASCDFQIKKVSIKPELIQSGDVAMIEDLVQSASNQALSKSQELASAEMGKLTGGFKLPF